MRSHYFKIISSLLEVAHLLEVEAQTHVKGEETPMESEKILKIKINIVAFKKKYS